MKPLLLLLLCLTVLMTGCSTVANRIQEKSATFNALDAPTQARLSQGTIAIGDTTDMVYIAIGRPDRVRETATAEGHNQTWVYTFHWQEYEGSRHLGHRRQTYFNPRTKTVQVYYEPIHADVYREREEEYMRVIFQDGRVTAIERTKTG